MAKISGLYNDGTALAPTLETTTGTPAIVAGAIVLEAGEGVRSVAGDWDLEESRLPVQIASPSAVDEFYLALDIGTTQHPTLNKHWSGWRAGNINGTLEGGNYATLASSGAQKPFAQMVHVGGTIYWQTSDDGATWDAPFYSTNSYGDVSACQVYAFKEGADTVAIDALGVGAVDTPALVIGTGPSNASSGFKINPAPVVQMTTNGADVDTSFTGNVTCALVGSGGVLYGTLTVAAVAGVATFSNLVPRGSGTFTLRFSASGVSNLDSASFSLTPRSRFLNGRF